MFSKMIVFVGSALLLFAGVARAAPNSADYSAIESAIPDSIDYPNRVLDGRAGSNEAIEAGESGNPDSILYPDRMIATTRITAQGWMALEFGSPEAP